LARCSGCGGIPGSNASQRRCARDWNVALGDVGFEADCGLKADTAPSPKLPTTVIGAPSCTSQHRRALHIGPDDERAAVGLSEVCNGHIDIEQAKMTYDKLSDARLLRDAAYDRRCCM
jgi:hypothetical protein